MTSEKLRSLYSPDSPSAIRRPARSMFRTVRHRAKCRLERCGDSLRPRTNLTCANQEKQPAMDYIIISNCLSGLHLSAAAVNFQPVQIHSALSLLILHKDSILPSPPTLTPDRYSFSYISLSVYQLRPWRQFQCCLMHCLVLDQPRSDMTRNMPTTS